ncbi:hypothetical protein RHSIM_Rhsim07G0224400 [Rhododendron simsii]|uniref:DUF7046 domain-containing protein n=1 Tax=Rhododendron simsii TaxID=118357 RepID=A0A834LF61_RHOSS|nr:hypothetical protein RHSIM_Rhsim07G0224400 [Rhododendron simsii]
MDGNGGMDGGANLAHKFGGLALSSCNNGPPNSNLTYSNDNSSNNNNNNNNDGLFQVIKAVEAAEVTIKQQAEENAILRTERQILRQELEKYQKADNSTGRRPSLIDHLDEHFQGPHGGHLVDSAVVNEGGGVGGTGDTFLNDHSEASVQHHIRRNNEDQSIQAHSESHLNSRNIDGTVKVLSGGQRTVDSAGLSQFSSPSTTPFSPSTHQLNPQLNLSGHGLMPMAEVDNSSLWKQDLFVKIREHEEEILQLRRHLGDYSIKEAQIRNEKYILEKRIAYMRLAFDQQQQDLVDAASKALSYRQDIIEENIRLAYALQAAQEERSVFVSSVLPLLAEYNQQPPVADIKSIVGKLKVVIKHLQEKLLITESKLKESHYQLTPWRTDVNTSNFPLQSPSHPSGLELTMTTADWDTRGQQNSGLGDGLAQNLEPDDMVTYSPLASRNTASQDVRAPLSVSQRDLRSARYTEETTAKQVTFSDPFSSTEVGDLQVEGQQNESEPNANWVSKNSPYSTSVDDPSSSYSPYLPPVLEEPSSSYSEAGEDDPLPGIEDLQITGDAFPGKELQACGISINGTTSCNFEIAYLHAMASIANFCFLFCSLQWVRHLEDGSMNYIDGAKQPKYLVTADDIDTVLAIEVQPLDERKRKGEIVTVFANEHKKITCDPKMQNSIVKTLHNGHASFRVSSWTRYLDIWEPATLAIKSEGYNIKGSGPNGVLVTEKFLPTTRFVYLGSIFSNKDDVNSNEGHLRSRKLVKSNYSLLRCKTGAVQYFRDRFECYRRLPMAGNAQQCGRGQGLCSSEVASRSGAKFLSLAKPEKFEFQRSYYINPIMAKLGIPDSLHGSSHLLYGDHQSWLPHKLVNISFGNATEFSIISSSGVERRLREENNAEDEDVSCSRDAIVLTLRLFIMKGPWISYDVPSLFFILSSP